MLVRSGTGAARRSRLGSGSGREQRANFWSLLRNHETTTYCIVVDERCCRFAALQLKIRATIEHYGRCAQRHRQLAVRPMDSLLAHAQPAHSSLWAFRSHVHPAQVHRTIRRSARLSVEVKAEKSGLQRLLQPFEGFSKEEEVSFRWDPANLRWAKSKGKLADDAEMMITPLIGEPYMVWPAVHNYLQKKKLKTISPEEAYKMQQKNKAVLVDVRESKYYNKAHAAGCVNVSMFRSVEGRTPLDNLKRLAMAGFAMEATERNPSFRKDALAALPKNKTIAVMCSLGGTMLVGTKPREMSGKVFKSDPDRAFGRESRSLKACYELYEAGFKNIVHVDGGFPQWRYESLPTESEA